jgi:hypothetical protein
MKLRGFNRKQIDFLENLRKAGATSAETALTIDRNAPIAPNDLEALIEAKAITRAAPYRYYLGPDPRFAKILAAMDSGPDQVETLQFGSPSPARLLKAIIFWIILIMIPLVLIRLLGSRH